MSIIAEEDFVNKLSGAQTTRQRKILVAPGTRRSQPPRAHVLALNRRRERMKKAPVRPTAITQRSFRLSRPDRGIVETASHSLWAGPACCERWVHAAQVPGLVLRIPINVQSQRFEPGGLGGQAASHPLFSRSRPRALSLSPVRSRIQLRPARVSRSPTASSDPAPFFPYSSPLIAPFIMWVWNNLIPEVDVRKFQKFFKVQLPSSLISTNQENLRIFLWMLF